MSIRVTCPNCKTAAACPDDYRGKSLRCKKCGQPFIARAPAPRHPAADSPLPEPHPGLTPNRTSHRFLIAALLAALLGVGFALPAAFVLLKKDRPPEDLAAGSAPAGPGDTGTRGGGPFVAPPGATEKRDPPRDTGTRPAVAPPVLWKEFTSRAGRFSVRFPGTPEVTTPPNPGGKRVQMFTASVPPAPDRKGAWFVVTCEDFDPGETSDAAAFLAARAAGLPGDAKQKTVLKLGGFPGLELRSAVSEADGATLVRTQRLYVVHARLYSLAATGSPGPDAPPLVQQFFDSFKLLDTDEPPAAAPTLRQRALAWVAEQAVAPADRTAERAKELLDTRVKGDAGFTLVLGEGTTRSKKPMLLAGWSGTVFPFELTPAQARMLRVAEGDVAVVAYGGATQRRPEKLTLALSDLKIDATAPKVTGSVTYGRGDLPAGSLVLRLTYLADPATQVQRQPVELKAENGTLPLSLPASAPSGPVVVIAELCSAARGDRPEAVLSNAVAALVTVPAGPPKDGLASLQLTPPAGWTANYNKFLSGWVVKKPSPTPRSDEEELRIEECPADARTPEVYATRLKDRDFLNGDVPGFVEVGDKGDLPDGFFFKGIVKKYANPKTPPILGLVAVREIGGLKVRCYTANLRTTKDRPEGFREELLEMFRGAKFAAPQ